MSNFISVTVGAFQRSDTGAYCYVFKSPVETSLERFRSKLMYNVLTGAVHPNYFLTLTIMDSWYNEICLNQSLSAVLRQFWNKMTIWAKDNGVYLAYAWRIERGSKSTKRLHVHCILEIQNIAGLNFLAEVQKRWEYCDWAVLMEDPERQPFEPIIGGEMVLAYVCKYSSKTFSRKTQVGDTQVYVNSESPVETKRDLKPSRMVGTNRKFIKLPDWYCVLWDSTLHRWHYQLKDNWRWNHGSPERIWYWERKAIHTYRDYPGQYSQILPSIIFNQFEELQYNNKYGVQLIDKLEFLWSYLGYDLPLKPAFNAKEFWSNDLAVAQADYRRWSKVQVKSPLKEYHLYRKMAQVTWEQSEYAQSGLYTAQADYFLYLMENQFVKLRYSGSYRKPKFTSWKNKAKVVSF